MGFFTGAVTVSAAACAVLVARENATDLSIPYLCLFVALGLLALILNLQTIFASHLTGGSSFISLRPSEIRGQAFEENDSLFALHKPLGTLPSVQVVLFHGLHNGNYSDAHLSTWLSRDGSCMWPKTWLAEEIPGVHVFSVCYSGDMYTIGENLVYDLLHANVGQTSYCPVILVGHSIGGLVIKKVCKQAHDKLHIKQGPDKEKYEAFLRNIKGIFFYSTPHHGTRIAKKLRKRIPGRLLEYFEILSKETARLNDEFDQICKVRDGWAIAGVSEGLPTSLGPLRYLFKYFVVEEAAARRGDFNVVDGADHFSICRPKNKTSRSFYTLKEFVLQVAKDMQDAKLRDDRLQKEARALEVRLQEEARARENFPPENFQFVPKNVVGLDSPAQEIIGKLDNSKTVGLVGMGGLGKTTLAMEVFNRLAPKFEYSCFVHKVKQNGGSGVIAEIETHMHCGGKKTQNATHQGEWRRKKLLLVLDDIGERDEKVLSEIDGTIAGESRIIFTSRQQPFEDLGEVHRVDLLNKDFAKQLFLSCAFPRNEIPPTGLVELINAIVQKCAGLPLALEVLGKFLRTKRKIDEWQQTLSSLKEADGLKSLDERLWAVLRESYNGLEEKLQQIFLDATTVFSNRYTWSLGEAKAAWRVAYGTPCESLLWRTLVDRSLVYDVADDKHIQVHEQLQTLGRKIASESIKYGRRVGWDGGKGLKQLQEIQEEEIFALRLGRYDLVLQVGRCRKDEEIHIAPSFLPSLRKLRYLEVHREVVVDGLQDFLPIQTGLVILECRVPEISQVLLHPALKATLVILRLDWGKSCLPTYIGSFSGLRYLTLSLDRSIKTLPDEIGNLSKLEDLKLRLCSGLETLPGSFGNLSALNHLQFSFCLQLQSLPESIGSLSALNHLEFYSCDQLQTLPESFGNLSALHHLAFNSCSQLQTLPESFGNLSALNHLAFNSCLLSQTLPESFGNLSALNHLEFNLCSQLQTLPESFGNLSALNHLKFSLCHKLTTLPMSFRQLHSLKYLEIDGCDNLEAVPESLRGALIIDPAKGAKQRLIVALRQRAADMSLQLRSSCQTCH